MNEKNKMSLNECSQKEQFAILAQITRNQYAIDYWMGHLRSLKEKPDIYRREIKMLMGNIERDVSYYNEYMKTTFIPGGEIDAYEVMLDNAYEFHREMKKMVGYYEQAMARVILKRDFPDADWLCKLATAKELLNCTAMANGIEGHLYPRIQPLVQIGSRHAELPYLPDTGEYDGKCIASTAGHFTKLCGRMNLLILRHYGKSDIRYDPDENEEITRALTIAAQNIIHTMMNYELIAALYNDTGHTLEEAKEIVKKRQEKYEKRKAIKDAKREYKQSKNN